jgi:hypothetical protein
VVRLPRCRQRSGCHRCSRLTRIPHRPWPQPSGRHGPLPTMTCPLNRQSPVRQSHPCSSLHPHAIAGGRTSWPGRWRGRAASAPMRSFPWRCLLGWRWAILEPCHRPSSSAASTSATGPRRPVPHAYSPLGGAERQQSRRRGSRVCPLLYWPHD